jgi:AhpD family alkylhydroperoxidase
MARDDERLARSQQQILVGGLPEAPGDPGRDPLDAEPRRSPPRLADELLVNDFPGTTLERAEREMLATAVSAANDCFYCMDSHGAFATALLEADGATDRIGLIDTIKLGSSEGSTRRCGAPAYRADRAPGRTRPHGRRRRRGPRRRCDRRRCPARRADRGGLLDVQPDGRRVPAATPPVTAAYRDRAREIASHGYSDARVTSVPQG